MSESPRVRVYLASSLDGFIAGPNHEIDWLNEVPEGVDMQAPTEALGFHDFMSQVGAMLMGRATYDLVESYGQWHYGDIPVLVATRRPLTPIVPTVSAVQGEIGDLIAQAKEAAGDRDVYLDGGNLVQQAIKAELVDELTLTMVPILLGDGIRLFEHIGGPHKLAFRPPKEHHHMVQLTATPAR